MLAEKRPGIPSGKKLERMVDIGVKIALAVVQAPKAEPATISSGRAEALPGV